MSDAVHRFLLEDLDIRGTLVRLGPAWHELQARRDYVPAVRDMLGELAAVTAMIGSSLKLPGRLSFQLQGHGPVRMLVMDCDEQMRLRGMAQTREGASVAAGTVPELLGDGQLVLTLQTDTAPDRPYQSVVPLAGSRLADIFEHYLEQSEQTPTRILLAADERYACGLLLQKLPDADRRDADGWNRVLHLAATVSAAELALPAETLLGRLFPEETVRLFDPVPVHYHCPRDEEKVLDMLRSLGREEVEDILEEHDQILIQDDICNHEYRYGEEVLETLFTPPKRTLH